MRRLLFVLSASLVLAPHAFAGAAAATFHVAPDGNDRWSGALAKPAADGSDGPLATLRHAQRVLRKVRETGKPAGPLTVVIHGGRYQLEEPLTFTPEDSGTDDSPTRFVAAPGEVVIISGGVRIDGWQRGPKNVWTAQVPEALAKERPYVRHLSVSGAMRLPPRLPRKGFYTITGLAGANPKAKYDTPANKFEFAPGQIQAGWKNLKDVEAVVLHYWVDTHLRVKNVDESSRVVTFDRFSRRRLTDDNQNRLARFYVQNVFEALDQPGEFYYDRSAGTLHYRPFPEDGAPFGPGTSDRPGPALVVVPRLPHVVRFEGDARKDQFVKHIELRGLTLADAAWEPPPGDAGDSQSTSNAAGAVVLHGARHCAVVDCRIVNVGGCGIEVVEGSRGNRIAYCEIARTGAGGIKVNGGGAGSPAVRRTGDNRITDNHLRQLGRIFHSGAGILLMNAADNLVAHNRIHDLYYTGISVGWVWGYAPSVSQNNRIQFNHISNVGQQVLSDMGGIYLLGVSPGTVVRGNVIHDVDAWTYGGWGIYTDEGSSNILIENNLVYRTKTGAFHQHYGKDNVVRNNIFALARLAQIERSRMEPHRSFTFERNIVYFKDGVLLGKNWKDDQFAMDRNVYWHAAGRPIDFPRADKQITLKGELTFRQWQKRGFDRNSLIADPLFRDPERGDFTLAPNSPALKLGFVPWDLKNVGPREREAMHR